MREKGGWKVERWNGEGGRTGDKSVVLPFTQSLPRKRHLVSEPRFCNTRAVSHQNQTRKRGPHHHQAFFLSVHCAEECVCLCGGRVDSSGWILHVGRIPLHLVLHHRVVLLPVLGEVHVSLRLRGALGVGRVKQILVSHRGQTTPDRANEREGERGGGRGREKTARSGGAQTACPPVSIGSVALRFAIPGSPEESA